MSDAVEMLIVLAIIFGPAIAILTARDLHRRKKLAQAGLLITDKTILSGTTPHQMGGALSERLRAYAHLPDTGWTDGSVPDDLPERAIEAAKALNTFSVLCIERTEGTASRKKPDGVDMSWRADEVRPAQVHISQAAWNPERKLYEMDEWISVEDASYMNPGFWFKLENPSVAGEYKQLNHGLLPETALGRFRKREIARKGLLQAGDSSYFCLETIEAEDGATIRMQTWIEQGSNLIRKARQAVYENEVLMGERVSAFADAPSNLTIQTPDWVEADSDESSAMPRILDHW